MERHKCFKLFSPFRCENPAPVNRDPVGESHSTRPGVLTRDPPKLVKDPVLESQSKRCGASTRDPHKPIDDRALESHFSSLFNNYQARILMEQPPQRVAITSSMLYAYAAIRGNSDKEHLRLSDPLHSSLYLTPCSYVNPQFEQPIDLRWWQNHNDPGLLTEAPHGAIWFQDVSAPICTDPPPPQNAARDDGNLPKNISYDEYKARNLRRYRSNHYTDSEGYANYGYLNVNGCWVDPDGKREIHEAENGLLGEFHVPRIPIGITPVPKLTEDQLYAKFIEEVSDGPDGDLEGDPRAMYITPAIFARWAAGASLGDHFVVPKTGSAEETVTNLRPCKRLPKPLIREQPQFDEADGSIFSGEYSPDNSPSLAMSSRGVNMSMQPSNYAYMNPEMNLALERSAYGDPNSIPRIKSWLSSSGKSSTAIVFNEDDMIKELAGSDDSATGRQIWNESHRHIEDLEEEHQELLEKGEIKMKQLESVRMEHATLYQETYYMERRINKGERKMGDVPPTPRRSSLSKVANRPTPHKEQFRPKPRRDSLPTSSRPTEMKDDSVSFIPSDQTAPIASFRKTIEHPQDSRKRLRRKHRIERYFAEQRERHIISINKTIALHNEVEVEIQDLTEAIEDLTMIHKDLRDELGIQHINEIPDLIPKRKKKKYRAFDPPSDEPAEGYVDEGGENENGGKEWR